MKKRNSKKSEVMAGRAKCESLQFQAEWGAKKLGVEVSDVVRQRIAEEIMVLGNMGLVEDVLALKDTIEGINPSLTFAYPFFLLSSTLWFSFAVLCTTNFSQS